MIFLFKLFLKTAFLLILIFTFLVLFQFGMDGFVENVKKEIAWAQNALPFGIQKGMPAAPKN